METNEIEPISPEEARAHIDAAIVARLGPDWQDEDGGWAIVDDSAYWVRLNRGVTNLDFQCDLLGEVTVTEKAINPLQASGRLIAWMVLGASLFVALMLAQIAGILD